MARLKSQVTDNPWVHITFPASILDAGDCPNLSSKVSTKVLDLPSFESAAPGSLCLLDADTREEDRGWLPTNGTVREVRNFTLGGKIQSQRVNRLFGAIEIPYSIYGDGIETVVISGRMALGTPDDGVWVQVMQQATGWRTMMAPGTLEDNGFAYRSGFMLTDRRISLGWIVDKITYQLRNGSVYTWDVATQKAVVPLEGVKEIPWNNGLGDLHCGAGFTVPHGVTLTKARRKGYAAQLLEKLSSKPKDFLEAVPPDAIQASIPFASVLGANWIDRAAWIMSPHPTPDLAWRSIRRRGWYGTLLGKGGTVQTDARDGAIKHTLKDVGVTSASRYKLRMSPELMKEYGRTVHVPKGQESVVPAAEFLHEYYQYWKHEAKVAKKHGGEIPSFHKSVAVSYDFV